MTHSAGGPFGLLVAEARPNLVKATVIIEGAGSGFAGGNRWGMSSIPVTYDPPVSDPCGDQDAVGGESRSPASPATSCRRSPRAGCRICSNTRVVFVTADSSFASPGNPGGVAFLKQAGVQAEELRLGSLGIKGNGHMMMVEKNSRQVLQPIIDWIDEERDRQQHPVAGAAARVGRLAGAEAGGHGHLLGRHRQQEEDALRHDSRRTDVRAVPRARGAAPSAARDPRARRRRADGALHGARRDVGLGAPLRSGRLQGVPRRSSGAWPLAVSPGRARRDWPARHLRSADARHGHVRAHAEQAVAGHERRRRRSAGRSARGGGQLGAARRPAGAVAVARRAAASSSIASGRAS